MKKLTLLFVVLVMIFASCSNSQTKFKQGDVVRPINAVDIQILVTKGKQNTFEGVVVNPGGTHNINTFQRGHYGKSWDNNDYEIFPFPKGNYETIAPIL